MTEIVVTLGGLLLIALIVWWFWLSSPEAAHAVSQRPLEIRVEGGAYRPAVITARAGQPLSLRFLRTDATPCTEKVVFADLDITADLALGHPVDVVLPALSAGTHEFTCQMGMYRGRVIVQ